jgi:hypothetical protein
MGCELTRLFISKPLGSRRLGLVSLRANTARTDGDPDAVALALLEIDPEAPLRGNV